MNKQDDIIYHIVSSDDYQKNIIGSFYVPLSLLHEGFIHCSSGADRTLIIAEDCFSNVRGDIYLLKIMVDAVIAPVRFDTAGASPEAGQKKSESDSFFPHIYGSLNLDAVEGIGLFKRVDGDFVWPDKFIPILS